MVQLCGETFAHVLCPLSAISDDHSSDGSIRSDISSSRLATSGNENSTAMWCLTDRAFSSASAASIESFSCSLHTESDPAASVLTVDGVAAPAPESVKPCETLITKSIARSDKTFISGRDVARAKTMVWAAAHELNRTRSCWALRCTRASDDQRRYSLQAARDKAVDVRSLKLVNIHCTTKFKFSKYESTKFKFSTCTLPTQ